MPNTLTGSTGVINTSAMTTASLAVHTIDDDTNGTTSANIKAGLDTHKYRTVIIATMPQAYQIYGTTKDARYDSGMTIKNVKLSFSCNAADTVNEYRLHHLPITHWGAQDDADATELPKPSWAYQDSVNNSLGWTAGSPIDTSTDFGLGANGIIDYIFAKTAAPTTYTFNTTGFIKAKSITWGDTFALVLKSDDEANDNHITGATGLTTHTAMNMEIEYEDPIPSKPVIALSAGSDYLDAIITYSTKPSESDIISWRHVWKSGSADTTNNIEGVDYDATAGNNAAIYDFGKDEYKQSDGDIDTGFLSSAGTQYHLVSFAVDQTCGYLTTGVPSNLVSKKRMTCSGSLSAGTAIGEELTLTITGSGGDFAGKFAKFGVNWDGDATPANDSIKDYTIVALDEAATTATVKHTFHKADTYKVNICTIDADGFRSDFTLGESRTIAASNPVAVLRASRDTAVRAKYGDEFSVVTLSASHSYPVGSDKFVWAHRFQHNSSTPVTTYPMENDNSNFNDVTTTVKLKCNTANCAGTVLKVYGKVSVSSDGTPNVDNDASFDHYEYQVHEVSSSDTVETFGTVAQTGGENVLFKSVDFVVVSTLDAQDATAGAVYTLADGDGNVINNKIRAAKNTDKWGGYADRVAVTCAFHTGNKTITNTGGTFLTDGFVPGDTIWVAGALEDAGNNGLFTVASVSANVITINEDTLVTGDGSDGGVSIYKVNGPTLPIASYTESYPTITCSVIQALTTQEIGHVFQDSADVTQTIRFESEEHDTLDLDTQADAGHIAIQSANLKRGGGLNSLMSLGGKSYPVGTTRTKMGTPLVSLNVRALTQTGYRQIWNLIEGGRYEWATIDSKKVDVPGTAYKQLRMRLSDGSIAKDPSMASQYTASLNFVVIGELVT